MSYFCTGIQSRLTDSFDKHALELELRPGYGLVQGPTRVSAAKIRQVVEEAGCLAFVSEWKHEGCMAFTVLPYALPSTFSDEKHLSYQDLHELLASKHFADDQARESKWFKWGQGQAFRDAVPAALKKVLGEVLTAAGGDRLPLLELGSGAGYALPPKLRSHWIRTQPSGAECQRLRQRTGEELFQLDVRQLSEMLSPLKKKVGLCFALNVFDVMKPAERRANLECISKVQAAGDRLLLLSDTNPCLDPTVREMVQHHPGHVALPYFPLSKQCQKLSVVLVPEQLAIAKQEEINLAVEFEEAALQLDAGKVNKLQQQLFEMQRLLQLPVIALEDWYVQRVRRDLDALGYAVRVEYRNAFAASKVSSDLSRQMTQLVVYKSVSDTFPVRQWDPGDAALGAWLRSKGLQVPHYDPRELVRVELEGKKMTGAEVLVIEATKL